VPVDLTTMTTQPQHRAPGNTPMRWTVVEDKQAICRDDNHAVMGLFASGYTMHQYREWLLTTVANVLDDDLAISSAGLLREGAIAWVEVSVPDSITTPEGVVFRPNLLATTSFDGSIATTFKRTVTDVVCDNTRDTALAEAGQTYKVRHSRYSHAKLADARAALEMVHTIADDFMEEVAQLCATPVNTTQWEKFLDAHVPRTDLAGSPLQGRARTLAERKRDGLQRLYRHDQRVAPWSGTAHGVIQAVNTYEHHEGTVRGTQRSERNMLRTVTGDFGKLDRKTRETLSKILV
jgi:phage/plasmid-like protein (TIGR03299 family)